MLVTDLLHQMACININKLSKHEKHILEAEIFSRIYEELNENYKSLYKDYFYLMKFNSQMENIMLEKNFVRYLIIDILLTEDY